ncbi:MAG: nucleotide exchange factor GrpE [Acidobacteriota bacterium]
MMNDLLRELRRRRFQQQASHGIDPPPQIEEPLSEADVEAEDETAEAEDETADAPDEAHVSQEIQDAIDDLSQEVRRVGRELFKTNRAADRNQELFETALKDLQRLTETVALIPARFDDRAAEMMFQAKASLCQELFRIADAMEASLLAAEELLARLRENAEPEGFIFLFPRARRLRQSLRDSLDAISQWTQGQRLLFERVKAALHAAGAREIECEGAPFDPSLHRAVAVEHRPDAQTGAIIRCELKGYTLEGRVLRYAEVTVAR